MEQVFVKRKWTTSVWIISLVVCALLCVLVQPAQGFTRDGESALRDKVLNGYNGDVRPDPVTSVFMLFHVTSISDVDIRNEIFSVSGYWSMRWRDDRLSWSDYPKIPVMQFSQNRIWTPVIVVSNSVENLSAIAESSIPVRVDRNGTVSWSPPGLLRVACTMDVSYFPFDTQTCGIEITSFGYTLQEMDVKIYSDGLSFRYYAKSGEWDIARTYAEQNSYNEDGYTYARVTFYFEIQRKPLYYGLNVLLPVIICSALSMFVFLLPAESGEKIGYCLTVLLAFMVILTLVADELPTTASSTSILQIYIAVVLLMGGLSVVLSIYVLHLFHKPQDRPVSRRAVALTHFLMRLTCQEECCPAPRRVEPGGGNVRVVGPHTATGWDRGSSIHHESYHHHHHHHQETPRVTTKQRISVTPIPPALQGAPQTPITWQTVSQTLDGALLRLYMLFLVGSSVVFVTVLVVGG